MWINLLLYLCYNLIVVLVDTYINTFDFYLLCFPLQINNRVVVNKSVDAEEQNCLFFCSADWFWNSEVTAIERAGTTKLQGRAFIFSLAWSGLWDVSQLTPLDSHPQDTGCWLASYNSLGVHEVDYPQVVLNWTTSCIFQPTGPDWT